MSPSEIGRSDRLRIRCVFRLTVLEGADMTGNVINLNKRRKLKRRADKKTLAKENTVRFGRSKAERDLEQARADRDSRNLDGHKTE